MRADASRAHHYLIGIVTAVLTACSPTQPTAPAGTAIEWPNSLGSAGALRYSPATDINKGNVATLQRAWTWHTGEFSRIDPVTGQFMDPGNFEATPVMIHDTLYLSTAYSRAVALDAESGRELWQFDPDAPHWGLIGRYANGFVHRGVAVWTGERERRVFLNSRWKLFALNAATGLPVKSFGEDGVVDLTKHLRWPVDRLNFGSTSPPVIWHDIVITGSQVSDFVIHDRDPPGDVQAFDARTGRFLWRWEPVPAVGTTERKSWVGESADVAGHVNVWAPMSLDSARGLVYLPVSTPSNDFYGGNRLGNNLYAESIVCLEASTGKLVWYQQLVHHGLWDYDLASPPILATISDSNGKHDVVIETTKTGFVYVFDRLTGQSRWPITERPAPPSNVPGEQTATTQPTPSRPEPFAVQGFTAEQIVDFTPEIHAMALAKLHGRVFGPIFSPPSIEGTVMMPSTIGGAGWGAAAYDPERQLLVIKATNLPTLARLLPTDSVRRFIGEPGFPGSTQQVMLSLPGWRAWYGKSQPAVDLPISKPPYGTLTAFDMVSGDKRWQVTLGDMPLLQAHPLLRNLKLPPMGVPGAPGPLLTAAGIAFLSGGGETLFAIDVQSGATLWSGSLGQVGYSNPMTYRASNGRQYILIATGEGTGAALQAFALPMRK